MGSRPRTPGALLVALGCLVACGGGDPPSPDVPASSSAGVVLSIAPAHAPGAGGERVRPVAAGSVMRVLDAPPGLLLASNLRDYLAPELAASAAGANPASSVRFVVTALPTVTVGEVNRALLAAGTRIVEMRAHDLTFSIEAHGSTSGPVRERVLSRLEASRLFESVLPVN